MLNQLRAYRRLRVAISLTLVLPRYILLLIRERFPALAPSQEAWDRVHQGAANQMERLALDLAGAFTKVAQIGGARADFLPAPFIDTLSQFHDRVPPRPFESLRPIVEEDLATSLDAVFAHVDTQALAAASLAQVHRARLLDGSDVVIKIRYPEVHRTVPSDLANIRVIARLVHWIRPALDLTSVVSEVANFVTLELDFEREAVATDRFGKIFESDLRVRVPTVYRKHCGRRVLVLEYLDGIQVTHLEALRAAGHKPARVAERIGALYGGMIFGQGYFHGDPHPGNLLVLKDGRIGLIDFGLAKELPENFATQVATMMVSALIGDVAAAMAAAERLGFDVAGLSSEGLRALVLMMMGDSDGEQSFFEVLGENEIREIPSDFALVARTLVLLNGLSHRLAPGRRLIQGTLLEELAQAVQKQSQPRAPAEALPA